MDRPPSIQPPPQQRRVTAVSCQDLLIDSSRWREVTLRVREDWRRCLAEVQGLEEAIKIDRTRRQDWARHLRRASFVLITIQNIVACATAAFPFFRWNISIYVTYGMTILTFLLSLTFWSRLGERSHKYLVLAKDLERIEILCDRVRKKLREVIDDGKITEQERCLIRDMIGEIHKKAEEISSMDLLLAILGESYDQTSLSKGYKKDLNISIASLRDVIDEVSKTRTILNAKVPHVVHEYLNVQIQSQIHAAGNPLGISLQTDAMS